MSLFNWGPVTLSSGEASDFLIDCHFLTSHDLVALTNRGLEKVRPFGRVEGVPMGGIVFASLMSGHLSKVGGLLIVDDVWTTGRSMEAMRDQRDAQGLVIFARRKPAAWVKAIFTLEE